MTSSSPTAAGATEIGGRQGAGVSVPRRLALAALLSLTAGCGAGSTSGSDTSDSKELAAQGAYTGALSRDSEYTLVGSLNHGTSLWRNADHERLYNWSHTPGEATELVAAAFSADGARAVTTDPRTLVVWDTLSGSAIAYWTTPAAVLSVALPADGSRVLMGLKDHSAVLFDAEAGSHLQTLLHEGVVGSVSVSEDGAWGLTGSDDETAALWNLDSGERLVRFQHDNPVRVVALSASGKLAFSAAQSKRVVLWDATSGALVHTLAERNTGITTARFSRDERSLLVGYVNRRIELWDTQRGTLIERWKAKARNPWHPTGAAILAVSFGPGERYYALAGDGRLVALRRS